MRAFSPEKRTSLQLRHTAAGLCHSRSPRFQELVSKASRPGRSADSPFIPSRLCAFVVQNNNYSLTKPITIAYLTRTKPPLCHDETLSCHNKVRSAANAPLSPRVPPHLPRSSRGNEASTPPGRSIRRPANVRANGNKSYPAKKTSGVAQLVATAARCRPQPATSNKCRAKAGPSESNPVKPSQTYAGPSLGHRF